MTVILTTHDMDEADRLSDRVAIIDHGKLLVLDTPESLKRQVGEGDILEIQVAEEIEGKWNHLKMSLPESIHHLAFHQGKLRLVGVNIPDVLPLLMERFQSNRIKIEDMVIRKKTLEDVFISLTGRRLRE